MSAPTCLVVFCGEEFPVGDRPLVIGRTGDVVIDDNPFLHRHLATVSVADGLVWAHNVGTRLSITLADDQGLAQTWLAPGARVPVVFPRTVVWFTAGATTYDFEIRIEHPPLVPTSPADRATSDSVTVGRVAFTLDQKLMCLALAENLLRRGVEGRGNIPSSNAAASRLGWTITKFNRKLDNVCEKLAKQGVGGLTGSTGAAASSRRSRLVEYVMASRLVVREDLPLLDVSHQMSERATT